MIAHSSLTAHSASIVIALLAAVGFWWLWSRRPTDSIAPIAWWCGGTMVVVAVSLPPVEALAAETFTGHMVQHLALWGFAPPLFVAARPVRVIGRSGLIGHHLSGLIPTRLPSSVRVGSVGVMVVVTLYGTHLTGVYDTALRSPWIHEVEHGAYLMTSVALWGVVLGTSRRADMASVGLALATMAAMVILGIVLTSGEIVLYQTYLDRLGHDVALADQQRGGALMWVGSMLVIVPLIVLAVWRAAAHEHKATVRREQLLAQVFDDMSVGVSGPDIE